MADVKKYLDTTALSTLVDQIKAKDADTLAAAKKYTDDAGKLYEVAGAAGTAESNAKAYTDELANGQVNTNKEAIATLNGDATTEGSVAKAIADAKALIDADVDTVEGKANKNAEDIAAINDGTNGILAQAKGYADGKAEEVQGNVDDLAEYVGTIPATATATNIVAYVQEKTAGIATDTALEELTGRVAQAETDIDNIEKDYLKAADKTELQGAIGDVQDAVDAEAERAAGVEGGFETRIKAIEDDYLKAADKEELQDNIDTVSGAVERLTNGVSAEEVDGVNDLIQYVKDHGAEVTGMQEDISKNAEDIAGVAGRMTTAEGKITALEGASALHAEKTYVDEQVQALTGADTAIKGRLDVLEAAVGESGSVAGDIADAKQEAIDAAAQDATSKAGQALTDAKAHTDTEVGKDRVRLDALEADTHTHGNKALLDTYTQTEANLADAVAKKHEHSNLVVLEGITSAKVTAWDAAEGNAKTYADGLNTAMQSTVDGVAAKVTALETASATHALDSDLDAAVERIAANEAAIAANASAIGSFTPITADEVAALFA